MSRWFRDNPLGLVLAAFCGGLLLVALTLGVLRTLPPRAAEAGDDEAAAPEALDIPQLGGAEPIEAYAVIVERPVFNETRLPMLDGEGEGEGEGEDELADEDVEAPEVELAGVVITPSLRLATLKPKGKKDSVVAIEGQPIEGEFGSWRVTEVLPREVTLASERGEEVQLKLQIHDEQIEPPPEPEPAPKETVAEAGSQAGAAEDGGDEQPLTRAEEIRQRIAERREELRRAAEEGRNREPPQAPQNEYQSVIQRMIGVRRSQDEPTDEGDEQ